MRFRKQIQSDSSTVQRHNSALTDTQQEDLGKPVDEFFLESLQFLSITLCATQRQLMENGQGVKVGYFIEKNKVSV